MTDRTQKYLSHRDRRQVRLAQLFAEATKRGIDHTELRETIAPAQIGKRLSNASEVEIKRLIEYIGGTRLRNAEFGMRNENQKPFTAEDAEGNTKRLMSGFKERYDELGFRDGMATPKQLRMIESMWMEVSRMPNYAAKQKALEGFLMRVVRVQQLEWVEDWMVQKIVNAINHMKR